jgi:hypothetical protein
MRLEYPHASGGSSNRWFSGLKQFYKSEKLYEPMEIINAQEMAEAFKAIELNRFM